MKKYLIGFAIVISIILFCSFTYNVVYTTVDVRCRTIEGHTYIIASTSSSGRTAAARPGGVAIIHAESCPCKRNKK